LWGFSAGFAIGEMPALRLVMIWPLAGQLSRDFQDFHLSCDFWCQWKQSLALFSEEL